MINKKKGILFTREKLEELKKSGKIRGYSGLDQGHRRKEFTEGGRKVAKHYSLRSPGKDYVASNLLKWCNDKAITLEEEYRFDEKRKFKFDWAIPSLKIAVEYEGAIFDPNGPHRHVRMMQKDMEKYNLASQRGWRVLRYASHNYEQLLPELNIAYNQNSQQ